MPSLSKLLFLIGLPGSGKTTVGQLLSKRMGVPFTDLDQVIVKASGQSIASIFEEKGEDFFRQLEASCLAGLLKKQTIEIVSVGGGTPCFFDNLDNMKAAGFTCYLKTSWVTLAAREVVKGSVRPLFQGLNAHNATKGLEARFSWRLPIYEKADLIVNTEDKSAEEVVSEIVDLISKTEANGN